MADALRPRHSVMLLGHPRRFLNGVCRMAISAKRRSPKRCPREARSRVSTVPSTSRPGERQRAYSELAARRVEAFKIVDDFSTIVPRARALLHVHLHLG